MAISTEIVAVKYYDVSAGVGISVAMPAFEASDVFVYYGKESLVAVQNTDYTVALASEFDTFTVTPTASLISKIDALIADDDDEVNYITVRRSLDYTTEATPAGVRYTEFTSREFERTVMRVQQIAEKLQRTIVLSPNFVGGDTELVISEVTENAVLLFGANGTVISGPSITDVESAAENAGIAIAKAEEAAQSASDAADVLEELQAVSVSASEGAAGATYNEATNTFEFTVPKGEQGDQGVPGASTHEAVPVGAIHLWASETIPATYMKLEGQSFDETIYPDLYAWNGDSNILPDWRDRVPRGAGTLAGTIGTQLEDAMQRITGSASRSGGTGLLSADANLAGAFSLGDSHSNVVSSTGSAGREMSFDSGDSPGAKVNDTETRVKSVAVHYIVKAYHAEGVDVGTADVDAMVLTLNKALTHDEQTFTALQIAQFQENIGVGALIAETAGLIKLASITASNDATIDITDFTDPTKYIGYKIMLSSVLPATDVAVLRMKVSSDNGDNFISTSIYDFSMSYYYANTRPSPVGGNNEAYAALTSGCGNQVGDGGVTGEMTLLAFDTVGVDNISLIGHYGDNSPTRLHIHSTVVIDDLVAHDAVQFYFTTGNVASGTFTVLGITK